MLELRVLHKLLLIVNSFPIHVQENSLSLGYCKNPMNPLVYVLTTNSKNMEIAQDIYKAVIQKVVDIEIVLPSIPRRGGRRSDRTLPKK
ncbi:unnamed protein product [Clavelina lepadiformis]|uniref:Uncharacterized protein n=1 Tax=Clavelina lepadiformis TaxID=159417 RepID=A0ABP0FWS5_CLALP